MTDPPLPARLAALQLARCMREEVRRRHYNCGGLTTVESADVEVWAADLEAALLVGVEPQETTGVCRDCEHLRPFELAPELNTCPVVNIRIHTESAGVFGCNQFAPAAARVGVEPPR